MKTLTYETAKQLFNPPGWGERMSITNDGDRYTIRDEDGTVVHTCVEYLDAVAWIRSQRPDLPEHAVGFAPEPATVERGR